MIQIDVAFLPTELEAKYFEGSLAVLFDVIRATTTITTALANGCAAIHPVLSVEDALTHSVRRRNPSNAVLLGGERGGKRVEGFDLGNSPEDYRRDVVYKKEILFTTTNGTRALLALHGAEPILIGSFLNISALSRHVQHLAQPPFSADPFSVLLACSGVMNTFALEDAVCAGMLVNVISETTDCVKTPAAQSAEILYRHYRHDLLAMLRASDGGQKIIDIGLEKDLAFCARVDRIPLLPYFKEGKIVV